MDLKHFRLIKSIADQGNMTTAKEELCLTTSALSHQLRTLEGELGFKIFVRKRVKWELTESGRELYDLANSVLQSVDQKLGQIKRNHQNEGGKIRVSSECYTFYLLFPKFLERMGMLYPNIDIQLRYHTTHHPLENLLKHEVDVALVTTKPRQEDLHTTKLLKDELFAVLHRESPLAKHKYLEPKHFIDQHLLIHSYPLETVTVYEKYLKPNRITPSKISAIPLTELALEMVSSNQGITCIPKWMLKPFAHQNELILRPIGKTRLTREIYLIMRDEDLHKMHFADFLANFKEILHSDFPEYTT